MLVTCMPVCASVHVCLRSVTCEAHTLWSHDVLVYCFERWRPGLGDSLVQRKEQKALELHRQM